MDVHCVENPAAGTHIRVPGVGVIEVDRTEQGGRLVWGRTVANAAVEAAERAALGAWPLATHADLIAAWFATRHAEGDVCVLNVTPEESGAVLVQGWRVGTVERTLNSERGRTDVAVVDVNGNRWTGHYCERADALACRLRPAV